MSPTEAPLDEKRLELAKQTIAAYGEHISPAAREAILKQQVAIGMSPYEAYLAGGAYSFVVQADPSVWPAGADPNLVIQRQTLCPDNSKIQLNFANATQFPLEGLTAFKVHFEKGRAVSIEKLAAHK